MMKRRAMAWVTAAVGMTATWATAQTSPEIVTKPWPDGEWGKTNDRLLYQEQGHVKGEDQDAQVFWWDSTGRFRFDTSDPHTLTLGYHWATMDFGTHSETIPNHLDDISLAAAIPLMKSDTGTLSVILGAGYSSDTPFADINGLYGIGHVVYERPLAKDESLFFTLDYNGNNPFMPDVPLPGVTYVRQTENVQLGVGFPDSWVAWQFVPQWTLTASYGFPYTGDLRLEYALTDHVSLFGDYSNFFHPFAQDGQPTTDRVFYEMSRAELGVRYQGDIKGFFIDAALVVGYAFEQNFYDGFDIRNLHSTGSISDEPYIGLQLVGRF